MKKPNEEVVGNATTAAAEAMDDLYQIVISVGDKGIENISSEEFKASVDKTNDALSRLYSLILYGKKKRKSE